MIALTIFVLISAFARFSSAFDGKTDVGFYIYTRDGPPDGVKVEVGDGAALVVSGFNEKAPTKIIIHGFLGDHTKLQVQVIKDAYLAVAEYNIVLVDYGGLAADYHTIVANKHEIGQYIATFIMFLEEQQLGDRSSIHIIGFSAGGQVMSFVNDLLAHPKVGRMTALDPAGVYPFEDAPPTECLDIEDATQVDVHHTSPVGVRAPIGHVDVYYNGGLKMLECDGDNLKEVKVCSHRMAYKYFADSIAKPIKYRGTPCPDLEAAGSGLCEGTSAFIGEYLLPTTQGIYYLMTEYTE